MLKCNTDGITIRYTLNQILMWLLTPQIFYIDIDFVINSNQSLIIQK